MLDTKHSLGLEVCNASTSRQQLYLTLLSKRAALWVVAPVPTLSDAPVIKRSMFRFVMLNL
jgi:hypothetical protein